MNKFSTEKQKWLREHDKEIDQTYLANLSDDNIKNLDEKINDRSQFIGFFRNQKEAIDNKRTAVKEVNV
jgi:hypothetical protein